MVVATKLLARKKFVDTGKQFNMIAASWIQFMIHDWVDHMEATNQVIFFSNFIASIRENDIIVYFPSCVFEFRNKEKDSKQFTRYITKYIIIYFDLNFT